MPKRERRTGNREVEVLATLLVAYPQMSRVTFDPDKKSLGLVFLCKGPQGTRKKASISKMYLDAIEVFFRLTRRVPEIVRASWESLEGYSAFTIERDVSSISCEELNLTTDLLSDKAQLVVAQEEVELSDGQEDYTWSARLFLQDMLEQVKDLRSKRKIVAFREGEKVLVFDK